MGTKNNPGEFDCYKAADPDEPMFVLLGRDVTAPKLVLGWAMDRYAAIASGQKPIDDLPKVLEAIECAKAMIDWRLERRPLQERNIG